MNDLQYLENRAAKLREHREGLNQRAIEIKGASRDVSRELLRTEQALAEVRAVAKARNLKPGDVVMTVESARVLLKPKD